MSHVQFGPKKVLNTALPVKFSGWAGDYIPHGPSLSLIRGPMLHVFPSFSPLCCLATLSLPRNKAESPPPKKVVPPSSTFLLFGGFFWSPVGNGLVTSGLNKCIFADWLLGVCWQSAGHHPTLSEIFCLAGLQRNLYAAQLETVFFPVMMLVIFVSQHCSTQIVRVHK